jgi:single-strand DNA-binding protein
MINKAILMGRLTKAPETTVTTSGTSVTRFTIAINRRFNRNETDFIPVVAFGKTAEFCSKYFDKGTMAIVIGSIQVRSFETDGQRRYATEIIADEVNFGESKKDSSQSNESASAEELGFGRISDDDSLPF